MKRDFLFKVLLTGMLLISCAHFLPAQNVSPSSAGDQSKPTTEQDQSTQVNHSQDKAVEVLSDTGGVDVREYLFKRLAPVVRAKWYSQIPEVAYPPLRKKGRVSITFHLLREGRIENVQVARTSGDTSLDGAALRAVTAAAPFPPLPSNFTCQFLALKFLFDYNQPEGVETPKEDPQTIPCVKTRIRSLGEIAVALSPQSIHVVKGGTQQFSATVIGDTDLPVSWKVSGSGCSESQCGVVSAKGVYTAPTAIPNPPTVTITATLGVENSESASALVTIIEAEPSR